LHAGNQAVFLLPAFFASCFFDRLSVRFPRGQATMALRNGNFKRENNLYFLASKTDIGVPLGPGETIGGPLFVDTAKKDYSLRANSPAIGLGALLDHSKDSD
jgi:hypothetical protein